MPAPRDQSEPDAAAEALLRALIEVFRERGVDRLPTEEVVAALGKRLGRPISANRVARSLKPYGVRPRQFRIGGRRVWGYLLADLLEGPAAGLSVESCDANPPVERRDAESADVGNFARPCGRIPRS
jgi:hypothetical protein